MTVVATGPGPGPGEGRGGAVMDYRALARSAAGPVTFLDARGVTAERTRQELFTDASAAAAGLAAAGLRPGDRVLLLARTDPDLLVVLTACLLAGIAPCLVAPPPRSKAGSAGVRHAAAAVAAVRPAAVVVADVRWAVAVPAGVPVLTPADLKGHSGPGVRALPAPEPQTVHHLQLTSGSTSTPKAVVLTHANVAAQADALLKQSQARVGHDGLLTWLPLHHDMGLVQVLVGLAHDVEVDLMPPSSFLRDPVAWLRHLSVRRRQFTAGPPFAYRYATECFAAAPVPDLDLSALRLAYVGAEPIDVSVLQRFRTTFAPYGLDDDVPAPCYGMAETVLAVTVARPAPQCGTGFGRVRWRDLDREALDERRTAEPAATGATVRRVVSCGSPLPGTELRLIGANGAALGAGAVGSIQVRGPQVMAGYLTPDGISPPPDGWLDTGDLGLLQDGELFVVGRAKEMLIVRGRNFPPYDIEEIVERHPDVGAGGSVVFSVDGEGRGTERVVAVVETGAGPDRAARVGSDVAAAVREAFGLSLDTVLTVAPGGIPRTTSGKRRRQALRSDYLAGRLG